MRYVYHFLLSLFGIPLAKSSQSHPSYDFSSIATFIMGIKTNGEIGGKLTVLNLLGNRLSGCSVYCEQVGSDQCESCRDHLTTLINTLLSVSRKHPYLQSLVGLLKTEEEPTESFERISTVNWANGVKTTSYASSTSTPMKFSGIGFPQATPFKPSSSQVPNSNGSKKRSASMAMEPSSLSTVMSTPQSNARRSVLSRQFQSPIPTRSLPSPGNTFTPPAFRINNNRDANRISCLGVGVVSACTSKLEQGVQESADFRNAALCFGNAFLVAEEIKFNHFVRYLDISDNTTLDYSDAQPIFNAIEMNVALKWVRCGKELSPEMDESKLRSFRFRNAIAVFVRGANLNKISKQLILEYLIGPGALISSFLVYHRQYSGNDI